MNRIGKYILLINGGACMGIHQLMIIVPMLYLTILNPEVNIDESIEYYYHYYEDY